MKWTIKNKTIPLNHSQIEKLLLANRQIEDTQGFFNPTHPLKISLKALKIEKKSIQKAISLIFKALEKKEKIIIFGDYDADGICASGILWRILYDLGCDALPFIPDRKKHGYGITPNSLAEVMAKYQPKLVISVDNGIVAHQAIEFLNQQKINSIITDHHAPENTLPLAGAIVHTTQLCGASVAWILARELLKTIKLKQTDFPQISSFNPKIKLNQDYEKIINEQLDLCGIATIADQVPLTQENRSFAKWGIEVLQNTQRLGLKKIFSSAKIETKKINANTINFAIAPRINAMGRLKNGLPALKLLCTPNHKQADQLANELAETNVLRQEITAKQVELAEIQLQTQLDQPLLITHSTEYHEGVIGLIAGRLCEKYHKPVIAISLNEKIAKGSARSIADINIVELIRKVQSDLLAVGGHPMAAGFSLEIDKLELVKEKLQQVAGEIEKKLFDKSLEIETIIPLSLVNETLLKTIAKFRPFGQKNPEPIFGLKNLMVIQASSIGADQNHLRLSVKDDQENYLSTIGWRLGSLAPTLKTGDKIDLAGTFSLNEWQDKISVQMILQSLIKTE